MTLEFDPGEFCVPSSDDKGHSARLTFRAAPGYFREMELIMSSRMFPYGSKGDLIRHAMKKHFRWLKSLAPFPSVQAQVFAIEEIIKDEEFYQQFASIFDSLGTSVSRAISQGDISRAVSLVARVKARIDEMPDGPWKSKYKKELDIKFGHILSGQGMSLIGGE